MTYEDFFGGDSQLSRQSTSEVALLDEKEVVSQSCFTHDLTQTQHLSDPSSTKLDLRLVIFMAQTLLNCGVPPEDIAIITPLNSEKNYIQTKLNVK